VKLFHLYGLAVASEFECPELTEITPEQAAARNYETVHLTRATKPLELPEGRQYAPWMRATRDACLYQFADIARMLVERPDRITVEMLPGAVESDMRAFLFGTGFGTLVHMRDLIPLHIAAIETPEGVVAFTGPSGSGKSTKVAELHFKHGWPIVCDDVAVLRPNEDEPFLHAGVNRIKLWRDAVERFGLDNESLIVDIARENKFHFTSANMCSDEPLRLQKLSVLGYCQEVLDQCALSAGFTVLMNAIYRPEICRLFNDRRKVVNHLSKVAGNLFVKI